MNRQDVQNRLVYDLGDGALNIPELRVLLENIATQHTLMDASEVEQDFGHMGRRKMLLNARKVLYQENSLILITIEDVTERRAKERALKDLLQQKQVSLQEQQHRIANSLQLIASVLLIKARTVHSDETRLHLKDAHRRIMSVAAMQQQLHTSEPSGTVELLPYLARLSETLAASMIVDRRMVALRVQCEGGTASSGQAISIGLIVTELVINALKHAFPVDRSDGTVIVAYESAEPNWRLTVSDNGIGRRDGLSEGTDPGLGTSIIEALAKQLDARVDVLMDTGGTTVSVSHGLIETQLPSAA